MSYQFLIERLNRAGSAAIPDITFNVWSKDYKRSNVLPTPSDIIQQVSSAIHGNRIMLRDSGGVRKDKMILIDCNSLIGFSMSSFKYPVGDPMNVEGMIEDKMGIYYCTVDDTGGFLGDMREGYLCSTDIICLRRYGIRVDVYNGWYWEGNDYIFGDYLGTLMREVNIVDDKLKADTKRSIVSFSGKLTQKGYYHLSAFMYSYARCWLWDTIESRIEYIWMYSDAYLLREEDYLTKVKGWTVNGKDILSDKPGYFKVVSQVDYAELYSAGKVILRYQGKEVRG